LGGNAFHTRLVCGHKERDPLARIEIAVAKQITPRGNVSQHFLTPLKRHSPQVVTLEVKQIENVIHDWDVTPGRSMPVTLADACTLLHQAERGPALFVQGDDFAVENGGLRFD